MVVTRPEGAISRLRATGRKRILLLDQVVSSGSNFLSLILASRVLPENSFAFYALFQLIATTSIGLMRAVFAGPTLAAQRTSGKATLPRRWSLPVVGLFTVVVVPLYLLAGSPGGSGISAAWITTAVGVTIAVLMQDYLRYWAMSASRVELALSSDLLWLFITAGGLAALPLLTEPSAITVALMWGLGALVACAVTAVPMAASRGVAIRNAPPELAQIWRLSKWAAVDATLTTFAALTPTFVTTVALESSIAGVYRILQTATGPLNLISSTLVVTFGLNAWSFRDTKSLLGLRQRVSEIGRKLVLIAVAVTISSPLVLLLCGFELSASKLLACLSVGVSCILGAWVSPRMAAAQALGYQRYGAAVRVANVGVVIGCTYLALIKAPGFVTDPMGPSILAGAVVTATGWSFAYRKVLTSEIAAAAARPERAGV